MQRIIFLLLLLQTGARLFAADSLQIASPDKKISVGVQCSGKLSYSISYNGKRILLPSFIGIDIAGQSYFGDNVKLSRSNTNSVQQTITPVLAEKRNIINDEYNELRIDFTAPFSLYFRVYNDGVAYRLAGRLPGKVLIKNETAEFSFSPGTKILLPLLSNADRADRYQTSFEENYRFTTIDSLQANDLAFTPALTGSDGEVKVAITESDLFDYPGMFLAGTSGNSVKAVFAPYPLQTAMSAGEFPQQLVTKRAEYIAHTNGTRNFPWRVLMIAGTDKELPANDLVYRLATPSKIKDPSWIQGGKCTDEWIIGINLFNVPFKAGINTETYKYYIDFAKEFGLQRIMMDAGWSDYTNLFAINPNINMDRLAAYAKAQGIRISMWTLCSTLDRQLDSALDQFNKWGVDFIMTDFMDRDDQPMVNFYERIASACADHHIMIMFHGAYPPKGFNRTWPNNITREGVLGSEYNIWSDRATPEHDVTLPFTRMLAGPLDYEPGLFNNATKEQFRPIAKKVMSQGTRCHQLAMFVVYDNPMQVFSGNPSAAKQEPAYMHFLGNLPSTWDETKILDAKVSDFIITARKKGDDWYVAGMTDWTPRDIKVVLSFLPAGNYNAVLVADGVNAADYPADYSIQNFATSNNATINVKLAPGGGFVMKLTRLNR